MKNSIFCNGWLCFILSFCSLFAQGQQDFLPENVKKDWEALTKDGGVWITHDNTDGYDAYGMKFTWGLGKKTVNGILYAIKDGKNIGTFWEYKLYYHPKEKRIVLEQFGSDGSVGMGTIIIFDNLKSENISTFYWTNGSTSKLKHVQEIKDDIKTSQTYLINDKDEWIKDRYYVWKREKGSN